MENNIYTCIEIGSYEIKILVCNLREERLFVLAQKSVESAGIERGQITNFDKLVGQIKKVKEQVELDLKQPLKNLILTVPPIDVAIEPVMGKINLDVKQPINAEDVRKLFLQAMQQPHHETYLPVGLIPRLFRIDESHVVQNPRGLSGMNLSFEAQRVLMPTTTISNLVYAVESSGFKVDDIIIGSIAETLLTLSTPEMYARTCHINIGNSMTTLTIVNDGKVIHARSLSIGGRDITRAISEKFDISETTADHLKISYGKILSPTDETPDNQVIYVGNNDEKTKFITRGMLNEAITNWSNELFKVIKMHVVDEMRLREQEYHYVLTGGTAELPNILYSLQNQLPMFATIHRPTMLGVRDAKFSSLVGVAIFAHELALLFKTNTQTIELEAAKKETSIAEAKTKKDIIPQVEKVEPPFAQMRMENTQTLKDAIAGVANQTNDEPEVATNEIPIFDDFEDFNMFEEVDEEVEISQNKLATDTDDYIDHKLENSGVLARFFDRILNEKDEEEA